MPFPFKRPVVGARYFFQISCVLIFSCFSFSLAATPTNDPGDAAISSGAPHIPEPMVFDLVRPLGVKQGEAEANVLVSHSLRNGFTEWAPEFEFGFLDDYAIEFELPFDNLSLSQYKLGLQGTIGTLLNNHFIHGWQILFYHDRHQQKYSADWLYLAGYRWSTGISTFNMLGLRRDDFEKNGKYVGVFNTSGFYDYSEKLTLGIELNTEFEEHSHWKYLLTPPDTLGFQPECDIAIWHRR